MMNLFIEIYPNNKLILLGLNSSNITLKVKGIGYNHILGYAPEVNCFFGKNYYPNEIYINGNKQDKVNYIYYFNQSDNVVDLIWNNNINNCREMFRVCINVTEIDLYYFDTSKVTDMTSMFAYCYSLTSINLSSFDTSSVTNLGFMFYHCFSLVSLDLSSFDTSKVTRTIDMFNSCEKLEYINLKNFDENSLSKYDNTFYNVPNNIVICINEANIKNKLLPLIKSKKCYNIDCSDNYKLKQKKLVEEIGLCVDKCDNITQNDLDCYKNPKGYYLDMNDTQYKKCFYTCETCEIKGDYISHNCLTCNRNYTFSINIKNNNYINCYEACNYYFYFDNNNNFYCTSNFSCPDEYPTLKEDKNECIKYDIKNIIKDIIIPETNDTKENIEYYNNILENLETGFR